jgi:hypothetical protein
LAGRERETSGARRLSRVTLAEAREARDDAKSLINANLDPVNARREKRRAENFASGNTLEIISRGWIETQKLRWVPSHASPVIESLEASRYDRLVNEASASCRHC